jgi:dihydropteroate synthase
LFLFGRNDAMLLRCGSHTLDLTTPVVMGILNVTPDSFSDGGKFTERQRAVEHALAMIAAGAGLIDVGGESTRPGAAAVSEEEEIGRVVPIVEELSRHAPSIPVSVDTSKAAVIRASVQAGAAMINDVRALRDDGALQAVAQSSAAVCLMHMQGEPRTMQSDPRYADVVAEVRDFLAERIAACEAAGIARDRIVADPGIGFGKRLEHNLKLLAALPELATLRVPLLVGVSRKSMFATLLGRPVEERMAGGLAVAVTSVLAGAKLLRVHDVAETVDAVKVVTALKRSGY